MHIIAEDVMARNTGILSFPELFELKSFLSRLRSVKFHRSKSFPLAGSVMSYNPAVIIQYVNGSDILQAHYAFYLG